MKRIPRRVFTAEFKREAIKLVTEQGLTEVEVAPYSPDTKLFLKELFRFDASSLRVCRIL